MLSSSGALLGGVMVQGVPHFCAAMVIFCNASCFVSLLVDVIMLSETESTLIHGVEVCIK